MPIFVESDIPAGEKWWPRRSGVLTAHFYFGGREIMMIHSNCRKILLLRNLVHKQPENFERIKNKQKKTMLFKRGFEGGVVTSNHKTGASRAHQSRSSKTILEL